MGTVVFDWDGTLHETAPLYVRALRQVYEELRAQKLVPERTYTDAELTGYLGMTAPEMWRHFQPDLPEDIRTKASYRVGEQLITGTPAHSRLYPGTEDVLDKLKEKHTLVILSACRRHYMDAMEQHWQLKRWFEGIYCTGDYDFAPKEEVFQHIRERFPAPYLMIGDRAGDLRVGTAWGIPTIGCAYGYGTAEELTEATQIATSVTDLPTLIEKLLP